MYILVITAVVLFFASLAQCSTTAPNELDPRINPTPAQETALRAAQAAIDNHELVPTTCTWADTPNGFRVTCGPAHVDPADCNTGFVKVCIRRYGYRTCDCYPDDEPSDE
jgi:hypothetical protein